MLASDAVALRPFYKERVAIYKALDGTDGRRCWRTLLREQLAEWLREFPDCASKKKGRLSMGPSEKSGPGEEYLVQADDL